MQPIRITVADRSGEQARQELTCTGFAVDFITSRIVPSLQLDMYRRSAHVTPVPDENGEPTGATTTTYGEWELDRRYSASGSIPIATESNNAKLVDPQTFEFATEQTESPVGEVDAIWAMFGPGIEQLLSMLMTRMITRGNLENPFA
jgi:hypothetical protein